MGSAPTRLNTLTSLRFFAALYVLVGHVFPYLLSQEIHELPKNLQTFLYSSFIGVPFFFTLSGFVLYHWYSGNFPNTNQARSRFWRRRLARLAPSFVLSSMIGIPWYLGIILKTYGPTVGWIRFLYLVVEQFCFLGAWFFDSLQFNSPSWSVSVEMFFYLGFPFIAGFIATRKKNQLPFFLLVTIICEIFFHWSAKYYSSSARETFAAFRGGADLWLYNPLAHLGEFCAGLLLARIKQSYSRQISVCINDSLLLAGILLSFATVLCFPSLPYLLLNSFLLLPFFGMILWGASGQRSRLLGWLENPWLLLLGESSYALYIYHWPLRNLLLHSPDQVVHYDHPILSSTIFTLLMVVFSLLIHKYFERPMQKIIAAKI